MKYKILPDRVKLMDSYLISKKKMGRELQSIRNLHPNIALWNRSEGNIRREWAAHSLAYSLNICRNKTADVDLEYVPKWSMSVLYFIVGNIALLVIK